VAFSIVSLLHDAVRTCATTLSADVDVLIKDVAMPLPILADKEIVLLPRIRDRATLWRSGLHRLPRRESTRFKIGSRESDGGHAGMTAFLAPRVRV
jgi:hypothetical protein